MAERPNVFPIRDGAELSWITVDQMRDVDRVAIELGLTLPRMMENAGATLAALARELLDGDLAGRRVVVLAGPGGNGGGGMVAARRLAGSGASVEVRLGVPPSGLAPVPAEQHELLRRFGIAVREGAQDLGEVDLFVDALQGYSQSGAPRGEIAGLVEAASAGRVLALDVPTGLELESGSVFEPAIAAEATMTLALPKRGLASRLGRDRVGALYLADISISATVYERLGIDYESPFAIGPIVRIAGAGDG